MRLQIHTGQSSAMAPLCLDSCISLCGRMAYLHFFFLILAHHLRFRLRDTIPLSRFSLTSKTGKVLFLYFALAESTYLYHSSYTLIFPPLCVKFLFNTQECELLKGGKHVLFIFIFFSPRCWPRYIALNFVLNVSVILHPIPVAF